MATDATGTPTPLGIPTYNINVDAPSGNGFNAAMSEIDTLLQARATLASPAFTGTPTAPTPAGSDNTTKLATTAFVKGQGYLTSAVTTFNGRSGAVSPTSGDYTAAQVTNAADKSSGSAQVFAGSLESTHGVGSVGGDGTHSGWALIDTGTVGQFVSASTTSAQNVIAVTVAGDSGWRLLMNSAGNLLWGPGTAVGDIQLARSAGQVLSITSPAGNARLTLGDATNQGQIHDGGGGGLLIGVNSAVKLGFYGTAPALQPAAANNQTRGTTGATVAHIDDTYTGGTGATGYTIGDIVRALKLVGLIAS